MMILLSTYSSKYLFSYVIFYMVLMCVKIILDFFKHLFIIYEKCYILRLEKKFERPKLYSLCVTFGCYRILRVNWLGELQKIGFNWIVLVSFDWENPIHGKPYPTGGAISLLGYTTYPSHIVLTGPKIISYLI
jgi:hypothetical protein